MRIKYNKYIIRLPGGATMRVMVSGWGVDSNVTLTGR